MSRLEKRQQKFNHIDLYPVITSEFCKGRSSLSVAQQALEGGVKIIQCREKAMPLRMLAHLAQDMRRLTDRYQALLIINDHVDLALAVEADGVHLGQDDLPMVMARKIAPDLLLGLSTHNELQARVAQTEGADYINIGPLFPTQTKTTTVTALGLDRLKAMMTAVTLPVTVMGGIKQHHLPDLVAIGATKVAMVTEVTEADQVTQQVRALRRQWPSAQGDHGGDG